MEGDSLPTRTYNHIAFKISEADFAIYESRIRQLGVDFKPPRPREAGHCIFMTSTIICLKYIREHFLSG